MLESVQNLRKQIESYSLSSKEEAERFRLQFLQKGVIQDLFNDFRLVPADQKKSFGAALNDLKQSAEAIYKAAMASFDKGAFVKENIDITRPGKPL